MPFYMIFSWFLVVFWQKGDILSM